MDPNANANANTPPEGGSIPVKKYIRTFAADLKAVQEGGRPDLTQLPELPQEKVGAAPAESATAAPVPLQTPEPAPKPLSSAIPPSVSPKPAPLETYQSHFADTLKRTEASFATVLAAEQDAAPRAPEPVRPQLSVGNLLYIVGGVVFLIAAAGGGYFAYTRYLAAQPVVIPEVVPAPIFVEDREQLSGEGAALARAVSQSAARTLPAGAVRLLYLDAANPGGANVFLALALPAPAALLRNIREDGGMAGVVHESGEQSPFFILPVSSFGQTFSGMLSWEPLMPRDLAALFPLRLAPVVGTTTAATSTPAQSLAGFRDEVILNHDARVYRDEAGNAVLVYGYWDQMTLVIARDAVAFGEILTRLSTSRTR